MQIDFGGGSEIGFERKSKAGLVKLTRASALNALTHNMILALDRALQAWEADPDVACVILEGEAVLSALAAMWLRPTRRDRMARPHSIFSVTNIVSMRVSGVFLSRIFRC